MCEHWEYAKDIPGWQTSGSISDYCTCCCSASAGVGREVIGDAGSVAVVANQYQHLAGVRAATTDDAVERLECVSCQSSSSSRSCRSGHLRSSGHESNSRPVWLIQRIAFSSVSPRHECTTTPRKQSTLREESLLLLVVHRLYYRLFFIFCFLSLEFLLLWRYC